MKYVFWYKKELFWSLHEGLKEFMYAYVSFIDSLCKLRYCSHRNFVHYKGVLVPRWCCALFCSQVIHKRSVGTSVPYTAFGI
ncbi:MAG: hypothetical protein UY67_C0024G0013 [Candidatus Kaiserbacteria bacterium GW2011_GWA2_52_12]|uniref:Uncharacterized protein n=1 Tax=Candidatus Kaiserbacteria bacterium GW2011_GWA2_52_12 TaxID=1618671 RepID=A0A0G1ZUR3_9BACT|nr:MAG: hypothetical protein UY67_C0024G0013 [Candidatus Kaiserbacteria bacterium GW2011_GWA2_52_12]